MANVPGVMVVSDPGSFRDPTSRVYHEGDRVLRGLDESAAADFEALARCGLIDGERIVATAALDPSQRASLGDGLAGWSTVVEHDRIPLRSYPYEWCFSMLQDAALLHLDLLADALAADLVTKDASAYNIQFVGASPRFIDIGSFERLRPGEPWFGYRQFCQHFLYPLVLQARRDVPFQPWLRSSLEGITAAECRNLLSRRDRMRRGMLVHVVLQSRASARFASSERDAVADLRKAGFKKELIEANVRGLRKLVGRLRWRQATSTWSGYGDRDHYTEADLSAKDDFVRGVAASRDRGVVYDLGANDGRFSRLAAPHARAVMAADGDALVVDRLYRSLREDGDTTIVPLVVDLTNPSGGNGWRGNERQPLFGREPVDLTMALAVVHHLAITGNIPLPEVVAWLADSAPEVVVEFPDTDDPMVQRLIAAKRSGVHDAYGLAAWEALVGERFDVRGRREICEGRRVLYHLTERG